MPNARKPELDGTITNAFADQDKSSINIITNVLINQTHANQAHAEVPHAESQETKPNAIAEMDNSMTVQINDAKRDQTHVEANAQVLVAKRSDTPDTDATAQVVVIITVVEEDVNIDTDTNTSDKTIVVVMMSDTSVQQINADVNKSVTQSVAAQDSCTYHQEVTAGWREAAVGDANITTESAECSRRFDTKWTVRYSMEDNGGLDVFHGIEKFWYSKS